MKKLLLFIIFLIPLYFFYSYFSFKNNIITTTDQNISIEKWETYRSIADKLEINKTYLKFYLKYNPPSKDLQTWIYKLKKWLNLEWVLNSFKNPISNDEIIKFLEWWNIYDIDNELTNEWLIKNWELIKLNSEKIDNFKKDFIFLQKSSTLEWFLYPDTYSINPNNFNLESFIRIMLQNFDKKVIQELEINPSDSEFINNIILASIVEKEEKKVKEKRIVAWVLDKRLKEDWFIWADATVCYPYKLTFDECTPSFIGNHIWDKNEYNTRNKLWLPKTAICNPSNDSIEAVYNKKATEYYYYLHDSNWQIHYARTNEEHVANKMLYIK